MQTNVSLEGLES